MKATPGFKFFVRRPLILVLTSGLLWLLPIIGHSQVAPDFVLTEPYPTSVSSVTVNMPAGSQVGDVVFVNIVTDDDGAITHPVEFVEVAELFTNGNGPTNGLYYRIIDGTEVGPYDFSFPAEPAVVTTLRYSGLMINTTVNPVDVFATNSGTSDNPIAPSVNTTGENKTLLQFVGVDGASAGVLAYNPGDGTVLSTAESGTNQGCEMMVVTELQASVGLTKLGSFSFANDEWATITVALNAYTLVITPPANNGCAMGSVVLNASYESPNASGSFELLDPTGAVIATESYTGNMGMVSFTLTPTTSGLYTIREQTLTYISAGTPLYIDSDNDSVCDFFDLDDDNDGIKDHVESPSCFFTADELGLGSGDRTASVTVTSQWTFNNGNLADIVNGLTFDNAVSRTNGDFVFSGQEFLNFTLSEAATYDQITIYHEGVIFLDFALVGVVQGSNDGVNWTDLTPVGTTVLADADSPFTLDLTQNIGDYLRYRIIANSGRIDDDEFLREVEFREIIDPSQFPKPNCSVDTDGDLVFNHLDLDSDGDGCSDALEAGATTDLTPDFQFPTNASGANGLPDAIETTPESGEINYPSTYAPLAISSALATCVDTDGDSVLDLVDLDDDNDGVKDADESPSCFFTAEELGLGVGDRTAAITVTSEWTFNNGSLSDILNGQTDDNAVSRTNGDFVFSGQEFLNFTLAEAATYDAITIYHEGVIFLDVALVGVVQGSNDGVNWTDLIAPGTTVLPDAASPHTIELTQNLADYTQYRIFVNSGRIDDDEFLREVEFGVVIEQSLFPKPGCAEDLDGDMVLNHRDLDSDGDGCSDALEAGATTDATVDFQFPMGSAGANGLPDAVETMAESGMINYTSTYFPNALFDVIRPCIDSDGDSVIDANDLDDDNDGIPDAVEDGACNPDFNNDIPAKQSIQISSTAGLGGDGDITVLLNGVTSGENFWYLNSSWVNDDVVRLEFPNPIVLTGLEYWINDNTMIDNGTMTKIQGSDDGVNWVDMSPPAEFTKAAPNNTPGVISAAPFAHTFLWDNDTAYKFYRLFGLSGGGNPTPFVHELFFRITAPAICDLDGDGIPNSLDLDSDGDGIPDNVEGQSTLGYIPPNADSPATYVANNGINSAYLGGLLIPDTDTDNTPDYLDTDADADQNPDSEESGLTLTGIIGNNGLDMGVETSDDYSDVNGVVNNPDTDLAKVTTTTSEVDYRDKEPPIPITVCHTSQAYNIGGSFFSDADEKLLNPDNFGDNGTARFVITLFNFGTGTITEAALIANGCQIFQTSQNNEFTAAEHIEIGNWALAMDHVLLTSQQNVVNIVGPEYPNSGGNTNPNNLTDVGVNVLNGPFGTIPPFNQGGTYQGAFDDFPEEDACVIIEDAMDRPTGLLNRNTGDFYLADADLLSELGGLTDNGGLIVSSTDILFANLYYNMARIVTEGPVNACDFFFCPAGEDPPSLTSTDVTSAGMPVDLNTFYTGTPPAGTTLTWHTASPPADSNYLSRSGMYTESGVVYAAFRSSDGSCYSPPVPLMVTVNYPDLEVTINPETETSFVGETQTFVITVTNNGLIAAPEAEVKVPIPDQRQLVLANPSMGNYSGSTEIWNVGQLNTGQSATLTVTIRVQ